MENVVHFVNRKKCGKMFRKLSKLSKKVLSTFSNCVNILKKKIRKNLKLMKNFVEFGKYRSQKNF